MPLLSILPPVAPDLLPKADANMMGIPVGLIMFSPTGVVPNGWLACEAVTFSQTGLPELYAYLGTNVTPDMRDRVLRHAGTLAGAAGTLQEDAMQGHLHNIQGNVDYGRGSTRPPTTDMLNEPRGFGTSGPVTDGVNGVPRVAPETRVKAYVGKFIIKAFSAVVNSGSLDLLVSLNDKVSKSEIVGALVSGGNGRIIESGSNANGSYVKFADGTMICRKTRIETTSVSSAWGYLFYGQINLGNWPATFVGEIQASITSSSPATNWAAFDGNVSETSAGTATVVRGTSASSTSIAMFIIGVGRWY